MCFSVQPAEIVHVSAGWGGVRAALPFPHISQTAIGDDCTEVNWNSIDQLLIQRCITTIVLNSSHHHADSNNDI